MNLESLSYGPLEVRERGREDKLVAGKIEQTVRCILCGAPLSDPTNLAGQDRKPCPSCGSLGHNIAISVSEELRITSHLSMLQERAGEAIGFSESERGGRATSFTIQDDNLLRLSITGTSPQGEEDTPEVCCVLLQRFKEDGQPYSKVSPGPEPADCILITDDNPMVSLEVQVVRAIASQTIWLQLSNTGSAQKSLSPMEVTRELRAAIASKGSDSKLPPPVRRCLVLALDATRLPGLGFDAVVRNFRDTEGEWAASLGFKSIWLVGPTPRLTWRIDKGSEVP